MVTHTDVEIRMWLQSVARQYAERELRPVTLTLTDISKYLCIPLLELYRITHKNAVMPASLHVLLSEFCDLWEAGVIVRERFKITRLRYGYRLTRVKAKIRSTVSLRSPDVNTITPGRTLKIDFTGRGPRLKI